MAEWPNFQIDSGLSDILSQPVASTLRSILREELRLGLSELREQLALIAKTPGQGLPHDLQRLEARVPVASERGVSPVHKMHKFSRPSCDLPAPRCDFSGADNEPVLKSGLREAANAEVLNLEKSQNGYVQDLIVPFAVPDPGRGAARIKTPVCWSANMSPRSITSEEHTDQGESLVVSVPSDTDVQQIEHLSPKTTNSISSTKVEADDKGYIVGADPSKPTLLHGKSLALGDKKARMKRKQQTKLIVGGVNGEYDTDMSTLQRVTSGKAYEVFSGSLILLNAFYIGWQTQHLAEYHRDRAALGHDPGHAPIMYFICHILFTIIFIAELLPRWIADGFFDFFLTHERWWNVLDVIVVVNGLVESVLDGLERQDLIASDNTLHTVSLMRLLRIVRIVRVVRVIRVMKFFRELRMMISSILGSMKNLMWVTIILSVTFYLFGVTFTAAVVNYLETAEAWNDVRNRKLLDAFGTVDRSALSLFMSMSGGNDWAIYYEVLEALPIGYRCFFLGFIVFTLFAIVNIVTGVFVEVAMQSNLRDLDIIAQEELRYKKKYLESMQELFEEMDHDEQGTITMDEFENKLQDERVVAFFNALKLDVSDARCLFRLMDKDKSGDITIDEFLQGVYKLQGESRALDMKIMQVEVTQLRDMTSTLQQTLTTVLAGQANQWAAAEGMWTEV